MKKPKKPKKSTWPDRIVLGVGHPWALDTEPYKSVQMHDRAEVGRPKRLAWPKILWKTDVPKYRLVLERASVPKARSTCALYRELLLRLGCTTHAGAVAELARLRGRASRH